MYVLQQQTINNHRLALRETVIYLKTSWTNDEDRKQWNVCVCQLWSVCVLSFYLRHHLIVLVVRIYPPNRQRAALSVFD